MKHSEIKQHIIETASFLFYRNGYNSTGINEIISEAGIAKATLYNHFKSKEDICLAYLEFKNTTFLKDIEAYCQSKREGRGRLLALFDFLHEFYQDRDFNGCWCIKTVAEIPKDDIRIKSEIIKQKQMLIALIAQLIENNIGSIDHEDVASLARRIYLLYESAVGESHLHQADWPISEAKSLCREIIG